MLAAYKRADARDMAAERRAERRADASDGRAEHGADASHGRAYKRADASADSSHGRAEPSADSHTNYLDDDYQYSTADDESDAVTELYSFTDLTYSYSDKGADTGPQDEETDQDDFASAYGVAVTDLPRRKLAAVARPDACSDEGAVAGAHDVDDIDQDAYASADAAGRRQDAGADARPDAGTYAGAGAEEATDYARAYARAHAEAGAGAAAAARDAVADVPRRKLGAVAVANVDGGPDARGDLRTDACHRRTELRADDGHVRADGRADGHGGAHPDRRADGRADDRADAAAAGPDAETPPRLDPAAVRGGVRLFRRRWRRRLPLPLPLLVIDKTSAGAVVHYHSPSITFDIPFCLSRVPAPVTQSKHGPAGVLEAIHYEHRPGRAHAPTGSRPDKSACCIHVLSHVQTSRSRRGTT